MHTFGGVSDHHHDDASYADADARRVVVISAVVLAIAAAAEFAASLKGHSAGVLADALHNAGDVVTTLVLLIAFAIARRPATRRFPSGFGRVEEVATLVIIVVILFTAAAAAFASLSRLLSTAGYPNALPGLAAAAVAIVANFGVSEYKIRVGRRIRSLALETDGLHSRLDALVSAAAFAGLGLAWMGFAIADPLAGLLITFAIIYILTTTIGRLVLRMMDAVDPQLIEQITTAAARVNGVLGVHDVRARWVGRELVAVVHIDCPPDSTLQKAHDMAEAVEQAVHQRVPAIHLDVHMDPGTGQHSHSP